MDDMTPKLTLQSDENAAAPAMAQKEGALDLQANKDIASILNAERPDDSSLTEQEKAEISEFSKKIDLSRTADILQYGLPAQTKVSQFSETALSNIRTKDMGEVGGMITDLVGELRGFSPNQPRKKGLLGLLKRAGDEIAELQARYSSVEKNVDRICNVLEDHKMTLLKDITMLDQMYELNVNYFKELTMYIIAGRDKLKEVITKELPKLQEKAKQSGKTEDAQAANYLAEMCNRLDKKLYDLDLTRTICLQMGPQIRMVQSNDSMMADKIQSSLVNTIPLWKNQMVLALSLVHSKEAIKAQREVTDTTNELLRRNAEALKTSTVETARESERGIVDIETLVETNASLISTLDEVMNIYQEGRAKRRAAEEQLKRIEGDLKNKLLELKG
jgi:uncharacterized protein YaaN involved in tellurite resistance